MGGPDPAGTSGEAPRSQARASSILKLRTTIYYPNINLLPATRPLAREGCVSVLCTTKAAVLAKDTAAQELGEQAPPALLAFYALGREESRGTMSRVSTAHLVTSDEGTLMLQTMLACLVRPDIQEE